MEMRAGGAVGVRVFEGAELLLSEEFDGPVELGRRLGPEEEIHARWSDAGRWRLAVAGEDEPDVTRRQMLVVPGYDGSFRLVNTSETRAVRLDDGRSIEPGAAHEFDQPVTWTFGKRKIELRWDEADDDVSTIFGLDEDAPAPAGGRHDGPRALPARLPSVEVPSFDAGGSEVELFVKSLHPVVMVLQAADRTADFVRTAARAVVEAFGMDAGCVLLRYDHRWRSAAHYEVHPDGNDHDSHDHNDLHPLGLDRDHDPDRNECWRRSRRLLDRLVREKRTLWSHVEEREATPDRAAPRAALVAPILNRRREVIGALYGERHHPDRRADVARIRKVDALLMEMLAGGLASGLNRLELEKVAVTSRVRFEQFFTPELADELAARPDLLTGREVEVTMLFADVRGFSRVSERIGPALTVQWIGDVLGVLSECVLDHHGVLVDYIGDELIAMWGAPKPHADHPCLACRAALAMLDRLPALNAKWQPVLGSETDLGIGVNTGPAQVGNTGTSRKFKYGALGNTVNLASRVQGATRYLNARLVVTGSTRDRLDGEFPARRLGRMSVVNIADPVELHELAAPGRAGWDELKAAYEDALHRFETSDFRGAIRALGALLAETPDDGPSLVLIARAVEAGVLEPSEFDPVWKLPGK
jgi:adenylate cyclase